MKTTDPIADYLTRIRNALKANKTFVDIPFSRMKWELSRILLEAYYIRDFVHIDEPPQGTLRVYLKYSNGEPAIRGLKRISRPGLRQHVNSRSIPRVNNGLGTPILTTSKGLMTGNQAKRAGVGGEILAEIW
ncbi:30S ribosomal protein S8 [bacterium]|nr:30S ribosomal protein S8 [bacterium]MBU1637883.1 30S ribosomal protein S8 [bacterium]MBU1920821.1 30S ribosomal protein S8 [bacterium]